MSETEPPPGPAGPSIPINNADGKRYWEGVSADINGMLGGVPSAGWFPNVSKVDLVGSRSFLAKLGIGARPGKRRVAAALEGGAGCKL